MTVKPHNKTPFPVEFIVDTGSPHTFIDENITSNVRIFALNLAFDSQILIGGTKIGLYKLGDTDLFFADENNQRSTIPFNSMKVSQNARPGSKSVYTATSILGTDFLLETEGSLLVNPSKNIAYIEIP